jgi:hypothetical protein
LIAVGHAIGSIGTNYHGLKHSACFLWGKEIVIRTAVLVPIVAVVYDDWSAVRPRAEPFKASFSLEIAAASVCFSGIAIAFSLCIDRNRDAYQRNKDTTDSSHMRFHPRLYSPEFYYRRNR